MFPAPFEYVAPSTLDQAIRLLQQYGPDARAFQFFIGVGR
jgi:CO/xanthine dehydrogenase FAD-binding subunit